MSLGFDAPWALLTLLLAVPIIWIGWRGAVTTGRVHTAGAIALRLLVLALVALALARPSMLWRSDATAVIVAADMSASVPAATRDRAIDALHAALAGRDPRDRVGAIAFAATPEILALPQPAPPASFTAYAGDRGATDIAAAIRTALATKPADARGRIVLVSDGNGTTGDAEAAADLARAAGVPIDVLPLRYQHAHEVAMEQVTAPVQARDGQPLELRAVLRSRDAVRGRLFLRQNGEPVDLSAPGEAPLGFPVALEPGPNLVRLPAVAAGRGTQHFDLRFEPDDPAADTVAQNNRGAAVTFVGGTGRVALVSPAGTDELGAFAQALRDASIEVVRMDSESAAALADASTIAGFDAVVLANIPRWGVDNAFDRSVRVAVQELGVGLLMIGGPESLGAGGWLGSELARVLPLRLDPPQTRVLYRSAIAFVIDCSGSMAAPVPGAGATQQEVANHAVVAGMRAMTRADEVGVVGFSGSPEIVVAMQRMEDLPALETRVLGMGPGGGTELFPAMQAGIEQLQRARSKVRHMVILTDGQTQGEREIGRALARKARAMGITLSAVGVGDAANDQLLQLLAMDGGGRFYPVRSGAQAKQLPQIFIRESGLQGRALVAEGDFPTVPGGVVGGPVTGLGATPPMLGYVVTVPRGELEQIGLLVRNEGNLDPLLAWHNAGLGRAAVFTGDLGPRWGAPWLAWSGYSAECAQIVRWCMRPADDRSVVARVTLDGETATVVAEVAESAASGAPAIVGAVAQARLVSPDGTVQALPLRQTGPGRFVGTFQARAAGAYLASVALARAGERGDARASVARAAIAVPYPAEYRAVQDDAAALRVLAERTGGRVLDPAAPGTWDLFERQGLGAVVRELPIWDILAIAASIALLGDVGWRRLAVRAREMREALALVAASTTMPLRRAADPQEQASLERLRAARDRAQAATRSGPGTDRTGGAA
ncbi:MAG: VWA domain-containing protein [Phycisphaerales bacterium]